MRLALHWVIRDYFQVTIYQRGAAGRVIVMGGLAENLRLLHLMSRHAHVICYTVGDYGEEHYDSLRKVAELFDLELERVSVLCNYPAQVEMAQRAGLRAFFCNHNAFIDETVYRPRLMQKRFDAVCNARPDRNKRLPLARGIGNLAIIRGQPIDGEQDDVAAIPHAYLNDAKLSPQGVATVLAASHVGLALSAAEGACLASSEYILCGLPVVSTPSRGGRDVWYDADNSLICEPHVDAVTEAVRQMRARLDTGKIDPHGIRARHIAMAAAHRQRFVEVTTQAFHDVDARADAADVFQKTMASSGVLPIWRTRADVERSLGDER